MNTPAFADLRKAGCRESRAKRRDFYQRYDVLLNNWYLLTSRIQQEIESLRQELHQELAHWRPHLPEPDWHAYAHRMTTIAARTTVR
jgi:DNA-binding transcriptional regulator PaaX